jgi:hypothetical protein
VRYSQSSCPIVRYQSCTPGPDTESDIDALSLWAGQSVGPRVETNELQGTSALLQAEFDAEKKMALFSAADWEDPERLVRAAIRNRVDTATAQVRIHWFA